MSESELVTQFGYPIRGLLDLNFNSDTTDYPNLKFRHEFCDRTWFFSCWTNLDNQVRRISASAIGMLTHTFFACAFFANFLYVQKNIECNNACISCLAPCLQLSPIKMITIGLVLKFWPQEHLGLLSCKAVALLPWFLIRCDLLRLIEVWSLVVHIRWGLRSAFGAWLILLAERDKLYNTVLKLWILCTLIFIQGWNFDYL